MQLLDIDFAPPATPRWHSNEPLTPAPAPAPVAAPIFDFDVDSSDEPAAALAPAPAPAPSPLTDALREHARLLRRRLDSHSGLAGRHAAEKLARAATSAATGALDVINGELGDVLRVGLVLSSGRAGRKKMSFTLTHRLDPRRRIECSVETALADKHLVLSSERLGRTDVIAQVGLESDEAAEQLREAVNTFLLDTAEAFAAEAGIGDIRH